MAAILRQAVLDAGMLEDKVHTVTDEVDAAYAGVDLAAPGDLVVVLVDRVTLVWEALARRAEQEANRPVGSSNGHLGANGHGTPQTPRVPSDASMQVSRPQSATA